MLAFSQFVNKNTSDGLINNNVTCFKKDLDGNIWVGTQQGISKCSSNTYMGYNTSNGLSSNYITDIEVDSYGKLWVGTTNGISVYDGISWTVYQTGSSSTNNIKDLLIADNGEVWLATYNGIWIYNGFTFYNYSIADGLPSNIIHGLDKDEDGVIWVASNAGLCKFNNPGFTVYNAASGMSANTVKAVLATTDTIYALCSGGLNVFDGSNFTIYDDVFPTAFSDYRNIDMDEDGDIWIGFNNGITKFSNNQTELVFNDLNTNLPNTNLGKIYWADTILYVATSQYGYYYTDNTESTIAQNLSTLDTLNINNIHALVNSDGILFSRGQDNLYEVPVGSGHNSNYASSIWLGGMNDDNIFHMAGGKFSGQTDWVTGPVSNDYNTTEYGTKYHRLWKVDKAEIDEHIANWSTTGYTIPEVIENWPDIAEYFDFNTNGIYDPENGDYPIIRGDQAILTIFNDDLGNFTDDRVKMRVEVHAMTYAYSSPDSAINNTIFTNYKIFNKSDNNYSSVYLGVYDDIDIGGATDDYMGTDTSLNSYYVYNGDNSDAEYGTGNIPAQSVTFLSSKMTSATYFTNNSGPATSDPNHPEEYYNYLLGYWKDGSPMTFGGNGYGGTSPIKYVFTGDPSVPTGWNENDAGNSSGDRRGVGVIGPFELATGQLICIDIAYVNAIKWGYTNLHSVKTLKARIPQIRNWYYNQNFICDSITTLPDTVFNIFARDTSLCDVATNSLHFEIYNIGGEYPFTYQWANEIGTFSSVLSSPTVSPPNATTDFYVTVTDNNGQVAIDTLTFSIYETPEIQLINDTLLCVGDSLQISLQQYDYYHWSTGNNTNSISIFEQGNYSVTVTNDGCSASDDIFVTVDVPNINFTEITPTCINEPTVLSVNPLFSNIQWNTGETTASINVNSDVLGQTQYFVSVTDSIGCINNDSTILVVNNPSTIFLGNDTTIDEDNYVFIEPTVPPGTQFLWFDLSTASHYFLNGLAEDIGIYNIDLTITDINGCNSSDTIVVTIVPYTGIKENNNSFIINIFPNPTSSYINISTGSNTLYSYKIIDIYGKTIKQGKFTSLINKLDLSNYKKGIYFLIIEELRISEKIIIK